MKKSCTKAAVDFLVSDLLKHAFMKYKKKGTETSVNLEEDPGLDNHDESFLTL